MGDRPPRREGGGFGGREGYRSGPREGGGFGRGGGGDKVSWGSVLFVWFFGMSGMLLGTYCRHNADLCETGYTDGSLLTNMQAMREMLWFATWGCANGRLCLVDGQLTITLEHGPSGSVACHEHICVEADEVFVLCCACCVMQATAPGSYNPQFGGGFGRGGAQ